MTEITRDTFSNLCGVPGHTAELVVRGGIAYTQTHHLHHHLGKLAGAGPVVLVTHGSDMTADDELEAKLPANVTAWFSMNASCQRVRPLPIGLRSNAEVATMREAFGHERGEKLLYLCATWNTPNLRDYIRLERRKLYQRFGPLGWATCEGGGSIGDVPFDQFCLQLRSHKYVLCPRGAGFDTHRFWEALYLGCIPVVRFGPVMDRFDAPCLRVHDWSQVTPKLLEREYPRLSAQLADFTEPLTANYWLKEINDAVPVR